MGENWLEEYSAALNEISTENIEQLDTRSFSALCINRLLRVYEEQRGILPLVQAMWSVPELRDLDDSHDEMVIAAMSKLFQRLGLDAGKAERQRLARLWLEMSHALLLSITAQAPAKATRSLADLTRLAATLITGK
jgi:hypothetical protein